MKQNVCLICLIALVIVLISTACASTEQRQSIIFVDISGGGFFGLNNNGPAGFSTMVENTEDLGYVIDDNFMANSNLGFISKTSLKQVDIYVIINTKRDFADDEKAALYDFVENGGNLIVICDSLNSIDATNRLLKQFDVAFSKEIILNPKINFNDSNMTFNYAVPITKIDSHIYRTIDFEDSEELFRINSSRQARRGNETKDENTTIVLAKRVSEGNIAIFGTKEFLKNNRYEQDKVIWHSTLNALTWNFDEHSTVMLEAFEIQIPVQVNLTFKVDPLSMLKNSNLVVPIEYTRGDIYYAT
ncbi:DUF4350 domain-containing protein [Methanolobus sp. ZRKC2]|uniref:hypothetical protein n=1 Tax=Methanolobus sp. ZRKC2 TaxID=3125783 RepID=UPI0032451308